MRSLRAILAMLTLWVFATGANLSGITQVLELNDVATVPGAEVPFWINSSGQLTRYDVDLGERLSVGFIEMAFALSNSSAGAQLKYFHGLECDTTYTDSTRTGGYYLDANSYLSGFLAQRDSPGGANACTLRVFVGSDSVRTVMALPLIAVGSTAAFPDSAIKAYAGEKVTAAFNAAGVQTNTALTFHVFERDSTGAVVP